MIKKHQIYALVMVTLICLVFTAFLIFISLSTRLDDLSNHEIEVINLALVTDGTYHGVSDTSPVFIEIDIMIVEHQIFDIEVIYSNLFIDEEQLEILIDLIYQNQSIDFDTSNYNTYTAIALFDAVSDALN